MTVSKEDSKTKSLTPKNLRELKTKNGFKDRGLDPRPYGKGLK